VLALAGATDCEAIRGGILAQPVNTISSAAFLLVGAWILWRVTHVPGRRLEMTLFGLVTIAVGVGSAAYHGPRPDWAPWAHDTAIVMVLALVVAIDAEELAERRGPGLAAYVACLGSLGVLLWFVPSAQRAVFTVVGAAAAVLELACYRRGLRPRLSGGPARPAIRAAVGVALLGVISFFLGRRGSAACWPTSLLQFHALWHVCGALAIAVYVHVVVEPQVASRPHRPPAP
jgi:hypothetical protein